MANLVCTCTDVRLFQLNIFVLFQINIFFGLFGGTFCKTFDIHHIVINNNYNILSFEMYSTYGTTLCVKILYSNYLCSFFLSER